MVLKVKEPQPAEYKLLHPGLILFTYLHLAPDRRLARQLLQCRVSALGYETVQLEDGSLPLLAPMSEVAGRMARRFQDVPHGSAGVVRRSALQRKAAAGW